MNRKKGLHTAATVMLALILWYFSFVVVWGNFWLKMAFSASLLAAISVAAMGPERKKEFKVTPRGIAVGVASAIILYYVFLVSGWLLPRILPFASEEIFSVYGYGEGTSMRLISFLLLFVTGPAEEIYWRGFLQKRLVKRFSPLGGLLLATVIYALVHVWTLNISLILAAFVAGLAWAIVYNSEKSLAPSIISHSLWGYIIFVLFPVV
ncbi:MAG: CPBP family intramembrane metalloprotease [Dethiobacter sp.]|jgi:membrane protease YdiL (CAAX protease family)|nr:CPBP family intramembrane metalloprotease [Dethiobacter sp.]